jgi:pyruvate-formate lyase
VSAILETHIRKMEQAYAAALMKGLDRLEERERRRAELIRKALENLDIEAEKERIKRIMREIQAKNSATRRMRP